METLQCDQARLAVVSPQYGEGVVIGVGDALSSPLTTSYRLPIVTIGLSLTIFAVLRLVRDRQTDGQWNGSSKKQHYALKCIGCQKWTLLRVFGTDVRFQDMNISHHLSGLLRIRGNHEWLMKARLTSWSWEESLLRTNHRSLLQTSRTTEHYPPRYSTTHRCRRRSPAMAACNRIHHSLQHSWPPMIMIVCKKMHSEKPEMKSLI